MVTLESRRAVCRALWTLWDVRIWAEPDAIQFGHLIELGW